MKNVYSLIILNISFLAIQAQSFGSADIEGNWILKSGGFNSKVLILEKLDTSIHRTMGQKYIFYKNKQFATAVYNPERIGLCGVGLLSTEFGSWNYSEGLLYIEIKGEYMLIEKFHYTAEYKVTQDGTTMKLDRTRVIKEEKTSYSDN